MPSPRAISSLLATLLAGCSAQANICPDGFEPAPGDRCIEVFQTSGAAPAADAGAHDGRAEAASDADAEASPGDLDATAEAGPLPDAEADSTTTAHQDAEAGATPDAEPDATPHCTQDDVNRWDALHSSEGLTDELVSCGASCEDESCLVRCTADAADLTECVDCVEVESACLLENCWIACGYWQTSPVCRACLCEAGCTARFEACAGRGLHTCEGAFDREPPPEGPTPTAPILLRHKPSNGHVVAEALDGLTAEAIHLRETHATHWSARWSEIRSFERAGQTYLLQRRSECGPGPCSVRISPLFADGSLGAPVLQEVWTRGWDELEVFPVDDEWYLLALKTGDEAAEDPGPGGVRIDRMDWGADGSLTLTAALRGRWTVALGNTWTRIEPLRLHGSTYLLRYATEPYGEADLVRVVRPGGALQVEAPVATADWDQGFDVVHTFRVDADWFVLRYKGGTQGSSGAAVGTVEILPIPHEGGAPAFGEVVFSADWGEGVEHVQGFRHGDAWFLLTNRPVTPMRARIWRLAAAEQWTDGLGAQLLDAPWSGTRPWSVMTVAHDGRWTAP